MPRRALFAKVLLLPYLVGVMLVTLLPAATANRVTGIVGLLADLVAAWGLPREPSAVAFEFLANVVLFMPLGVLLTLAWPWLSPWLVIGAGLVLSGAIELSQFAVPSRVPAISDVVANTTGAALGYAIVAWWRLRRLHRAPAEEPVLPPVE